MVLDYKSFMRQRAPKLTFGDQDFGVGNLAPQAPQGPQGGRYNNWNQVGNAQESTWGGYQPASQMPSNFGMEFQQQAPPVIGQPTPALASIVAPQAPLGTGQSGQEQVANAGVTPATAAPSAAAWDGQNYRLPSGEVLPGNASFTLDIGGVQVRMPGYYDPASATGGKPQAIFMNGTYPATAIQWFQRRMLDAKNRGENINDPNIIFREMARVRDDAMVALGLQANDPQLAAKLRAATGFVHLDRFVRGANGEKGYTAAPGTAPGAPAGAPDTAAGAPPGAPGAGGGGGGGGGAGTGDDAREFLMEDPRAAFRELMRRRGYSNMDGGGYAMQFLQSRYEPALQALAQVASGMGGEDAIANETFDSFLNKLQNGSLSRFAKDTARQGYGDSGVYRADAGDEANQAYYENLNYLNTLGSGGLVQRSQKNRLDRYVNQYGDIVYRTLNGEKNLPMTFEEFMRQNKYSVFR